MTRTAPVLLPQAPGAEVTGALWNAGPKASTDFMSTRPTFRGHQNTNQTVSSGVYLPIGFNATDLDTDSGHSNVTNNTRYVCQVAGWYWIQGIVAWNSSANQARADTLIARNGTAVNGTHQALIKPNNDYTGVCTATFMQLRIGDYVEIWGMQNTGAPLSTCVFSDLDSSLNVMWIHA